MRKAFVVVPSGAEVDPSHDAGIAGLTNRIISRAVTVVTQECVGGAVVIADKIITSLFLVRNCSMVEIVSPRCVSTQAVVARRDENNHVAELKPIMLGRGDPGFRRPQGKIPLNSGPIGNIGDPLLTAYTRSGAPTVTVVGMSYVITACERREKDMWQVQLRLPAGLVGGGIWNIAGEFVGLSLGTKRPHFDRESEMILALPADSVLDFAETA